MAVDRWVASSVHASPVRKEVVAGMGVGLGVAAGDGDLSVSLRLRLGLSGGGERRGHSRVLPWRSAHSHHGRHGHASAGATTMTATCTTTTPRRTATAVEEGAWTSATGADTGSHHDGHGCGGRDRLVCSDGHLGNGWRRP